MLKPIRLACVTGLLLLTCGCQSWSTPTSRPVVVQCHPVPAPAAWFMEEHAPDLTQRLLNELSPSPETAIKD